MTMAPSRYIGAGDHGPLPVYIGPVGLDGVVGV